MAQQVGSDLDFSGGARILNLPNPIAAQDPATKAYVDSAVEGLAWKDSVRVAAQSNIDLSAPGATINGVTMATNDRMLVPAQTVGSQNGIYIWNGAATPATRAPDASTFAELEQAVVTVEEGASAGTTYRQTAVNGTIGSSDVTWTTFGTSAPDSSETTKGLSEAATQAETDAETLDAPYYVSPAKLGGWAGRKLKFAANIGDGSATQYTVTHNLGTRDVTVAIYRNSGANDEVLCDVEHTTTNSLTLRFASAPSSNLYRVVVLG